MRLLLLHLQHKHQAGVLVAEEVQQEHQEVIDDVGLVALPACVHIDGQIGIPQGQPLKGGEKGRGQHGDSYMTEQGVLYTMENISSVLME